MKRKPRDSRVVLKSLSDEQKSPDVEWARDLPVTQNYTRKKMSGKNTDAKSLVHTKWNCKYHVVFAPKYRRKVFFQEKRADIRDIIQALENQLKNDREADQLSMFDSRDPFMGGR